MLDLVLQLGYASLKRRHLIVDKILNAIETCLLCFKSQLKGTDPMSQIAEYLAIDILFHSVLRILQTDIIARESLRGLVLQATQARESDLLLQRKLPT